MARKTKEEAQKTREQLMLTALDLFSEKGVSNTTLTDISQQAGVTKGAFYWHFDNKLQIFEAISTEFYRSVDEQAEHILLGFADPLQGVFTAIHYYCYVLQTTPLFQKIMRLYFLKCEYTQEFSPFIKLDQEEITRSTLLMQQQLAKISDAEWHRDATIDESEIARTIFDTLAGILRRWIIEPNEQLIQEADTSLRLILRGGGLSIKRDAYLPQAMPDVLEGITLQDETSSRFDLLAGLLDN